MKGTPGAAYHCSFRGLRWTAALTANRASVRQAQASRSVRSALKQGAIPEEKGEDGTEKKRARQNPRSSARSIAQQSFQAAGSSSRDMGCPGGSGWGKSASACGRRCGGCEAPSGRSKPLSCEAWLAVARKSGATLTRGAASQTSQFHAREVSGAGWLCSRLLTIAEVDGLHVACELR